MLKISLTTSGRPLVVQDQFPLFAHSPADSRSEFRDLLEKAVRMGAADIDPGFADALHVF